MPRAFLTGCLILLWPAVGLAQKFTEQFTLDPQSLWQFNVAFRKGATTVQFPYAGIESINGSRTLMVRPGQNVPDLSQIGEGIDFLCSYQDDSYFFTLIALNEKAQDVLTIVFRGQTYAFELRASEQPFYTIHLLETSTAASAGGPASRRVDPRRLAVLLNEAQSYRAARQTDPAAVQDIVYYRPGDISEFASPLRDGKTPKTKEVTQNPKEFRSRYDGFDILIHEVFRFNADDTTIFHIYFRNYTAQPIEYDRSSLRVLAGRYPFPTSLIDASGIIPPGLGNPVTQKIEPALASAWFCVTGTYDNGRNRLKVDNDWKVLVNRLSAPPTPEASVHDQTFVEPPLPEP